MEIYHGHWLGQGNGDLLNQSVPELDSSASEIADKPGKANRMTMMNSPSQCEPNLTEGIFSSKCLTSTLAVWNLEFVISNEIFLSEFSWSKISADHCDVPSSTKLEISLALAP